MGWIKSSSVLEDGMKHFYEETGVQARKTELEHIRQRQLESWRADALARIRGKTPEEV